MYFWSSSGGLYLGLMFGGPPPHVRCKGDKLQNCDLLCSASSVWFDNSACTLLKNQNACRCSLMLHLKFYSSVIHWFPESTVIFF